MADGDGLNITNERKSCDDWVSLEKENWIYSRLLVLSFQEF